MDGLAGIVGGIGGFTGVAAGIAGIAGSRVELARAAAGAVAARFAGAAASARRVAGSDVLRRNPLPDRLAGHAYPGSGRTIRRSVGLFFGRQPRILRCLGSSSG
jgi:hypothetical protein